MKKAISMLRFSITQHIAVVFQIATVLSLTLLFPAAETQAQFGNSRGPAPEVEISAVLKAADGGQTELQVTAVVPDGYYIYSMDKGFSGATKIALTDTGTLTAVAKPEWTPDHAPKAVFEKELDQTVEKFFGSVTWSTKLQGTADAGTVITGKLSGLYCSSPESGGGGECVPLRNKVFKASLPGAAPAVEETIAPVAEVNTDTNPITVTPSIGFGKGAEEGLMRYEISLTPPRPRIGQEVVLSIRAIIAAPYHTFAVDQNSDMAGLPTTIEFGTIKGLEPVGSEFAPSVAPVIEEPDVNIVQRVHYGEVTWSHRFMLTEPTAAIDGLIRFQMCKDGSCLPPAKAEFALTLTAGKIGDVGGTTSAPPNVVKTDGNADVATNEGPKEGLIAFVVTAIGAGFLALLTPCVFPMIPVTVAFFLKQEEKRAGSSIRLAIIYSLSIIGAFTILGLAVTAVFGPASLNSLANNKWLNLFFAALFLIFALMLMGLFELRLPSSLLTWTSKRESTGGIVGVVFMALTFTLVSFTCTFAFVGSLLAWAAKGQVFWPVIGMLAFSTAFASPFFVLAMFPSMLKRLPKSGGWMNDVKVTMGIIELALVAKFLSVADIGFSVGSIPVFITYKLFLVSWIVLSAVTGLYLLGLLTKPMGPVSKNVKAFKNVFALMFLAFAGYIAAGMFVHKMPLTGIWNNVAAFAPPNIIVRQTDDLGFVISHHELDYALEFDRATAAAENEQRPLFIDFTGVSCVNCRKMERSVLVDESVLERLHKLVRAQLFTDTVPGIVDEELAEHLLISNQELQSKLLNSSTLPFYAIVSADGKELLSSFEGLDNSGGENFIKFLDDGLKKWEVKKQTSVAARENVFGK